jgi:GNAT superfamily N-acetyltransferase
MSDLEISTDRARLDVGLVHLFLSTSTYWAQGRSLDEVERCIEHSLCFGAYASGEQVAFGRVVTDYTVLGYLFDIFVLPEWRGRGVGKRLVQAIVEHPDLRALPVMLLRTKDAHALYGQFGFASPRHPGELMARYSSPP